MHWSDVTSVPRPKVLRQFAALWLIFCLGLASVRAWQGRGGIGMEVLAAVGLVVGGLGLFAPRTVRWIYTGWMVATFPIAWTVSRLMLAALFFLVLTPVAWIMRVVKRDALNLRRPVETSYWTAKRAAEQDDDYLRQS